MVKKFLRYNGTSWSLDAGVPGPTGPAGQAGPVGKDGATIIFKPGAATSAPYYATWAEVAAAAHAQSISSGLVNILFDDSLAACHITAGSWDFGPLTTICCSPNAADAQSGVLFVDNGATFVYSPIAIIDTFLRSTSSAPIVTNIPPSFRLELRNANIECIGSAPFYSVTENIFIYLYDESTILDNGFTPVIQSTADLNIFGHNGTYISPNTLSTTGNISYFARSSSANLSKVQTGSVGYLVTVSSANLDPLGSLSYGTTAERPVLSGLQPGFRYFDTDLNNPIWWDGTTWITVSGGGGGGTIIFKPGVATSAPTYNTWQEVADAAQAQSLTSGKVTILFDDSITQIHIPNDDWDFGALTTFQGSPIAHDGYFTTIHIDDGCTFVHSPIEYINVAVKSESNTPIITNIPNSFHLEMRNSFLQCSGDQPIYDVTEDMYLFMYEGSGIISDSALVIKTSMSLLIYMFENTFVQDLVLDVTQSLNYNTVASSAKPSQDQAFGSIFVNLPAGGLDPFGALSYGTTANRPDPTSLPPGYRYWDTDLEQPIWWDGGAWVTISGSSSSDTGDNATAYRSTPYSKTFVQGLQVGFAPLLQTTMADTSSTSYAGADLVMTDYRLHMVGTISGNEGQHYSMDLTGFSFAKDFDFRVDASPTIGNPSAFVGASIAFNGFTTFAIAKDGIVSNYIYNTIHSTSADSNIDEAAPGGNDWSNARACVLYKDYNVVNGVPAVVYWTAPLNDKVWAETEYFDGITSNTFAGKTPTGICSDDEGFIWVSFPGDGTVRRYSTGNTSLNYGTMVEVASHAVANVVELFYDGKYVWALATDVGPTIAGHLYRISKTSGVVQSYTYPTSESANKISSKSRMTFDGQRIWVTRKARVDAFSAGDLSTGTINKLFTDDGFNSSGENRGITVDKNGNIYVANMQSSILRIYVFCQPESEIATSTTKTINWRTGQFSMPTTFTFMQLNGALVAFSAQYVEVTVTARSFTATVGDAAWKKRIYCDTISGVPTILSNVDMVTPYLSANATSEGWNVTFSVVSNVITGQVTQGTHSGPVQWGIQITRFRPDATIL